MLKISSVCSDMFCCVHCSVQEVARPFQAITHWAQMFICTVMLSTELYSTVLNLTALNFTVIY